MATPINTIYSWFETGDFPTQAQFQASWSSFWHKDESIPMSSIDGLSNQFGKFVLGSTFNTHLNDSNAHSTYLAKRNAANLNPEDVELWKDKLGVGELPENVNRMITAYYADLGITPESNMSDKQIAIASYLEGTVVEPNDVIFFQILENEIAN